MILNLIKVADCSIRNNEKTNEKYVRVSFISENESKNECKVKISMAIEQWKQLRKTMGISLDKEKNEIITQYRTKIEFEPKAMTKSKTPKFIYEIKKGVYDGNSYDYIELNPLVLIQNDIITSVFVKKYDDLFD